MALTPKRTTDLDASSLLDEVIGHRDGSLVRSGFANVAIQLAGSGAVAEKIHEVQSQIVGGLRINETWAGLGLITGAVVSEGAEVLDADSGTHLQATATGYDGVSVPNAGRYRWVTTWGRWMRIGDTATSVGAGAHATLQDNIDDEAVIRATAVTTLQGNIDAEAATRATAVTTLQGNIDAEVATLEAADATLQGNIAAEAATRAAADTTLQDNIDAEAATRATAVTTLQGNIDAEVATLEAADATLQGNIAAEAATRAAADTTLQDNIDAEAATRAAADTTLQDNIDAAVAALETADTDEAATRATAVSTLQGNIDAAVAALETADTDEADARAAADATLQGNIAAAVAALETADTAEADTRAAADATLAQDVSSLFDGLTEVDTQIDQLALAEVFRPGEVPTHFSDDLTGAPETRPVAGVGSVVVDDACGSVYAIPGEATFAPRRAFSLEPDRIYRLRIGFKRTTNSTDPSGDAVQVRWQNLSKSKASVSQATLQNYANPLVADGLIVLSTLISRDAGQTGVDYVPPATARYGVPFVQTFGSSAVTAMVFFEWSDVTDLILGGADVADLAQDLSDEAQARATADGDLQTNITAEEQARIAALAAEAQVRATADGGLQADIAAEADARAVADDDAAQKRGMLRLAGRAVLAVLSASDRREFIRLLFDRASGLPQWENHVLTPHLAASDAANASAREVLQRRSGILRQLGRGVLANFAGADGRSVFRVLFDRRAGVPRIEHHALSGDLGTQRLSSPGQMAAFVARDGRKLTALDWNRDNAMPQWHGHALEADAAGATRRGDFEEMMPVGPDTTEGLLQAKSEKSGYGWKRFPRQTTPFIRGYNNTPGTAIEIRRTWGLNIIGQRYAGTFNPGPVASVTSGGRFTTSLPLASGFADGYYLEQGGLGGNTVASTVYLQGDLAVVSGGEWVKQARPTSTEPGDFWVVSGGGTFKGVPYAVDDRIVLIGYRSLAAEGEFLWYKGRPENGETYLRGETATPTTLSASSYLDGDLFQVTSANGAYAKYDGHLRVNGAWNRLPTNPVTTYNAGTGIFLPCTHGAQDYEFRRVDKSATRVNVVFETLLQTRPRGTSSRDVWAIGDSMFGFAAAEMKSVMSDRDVEVKSEGGATALQCLESLKYDILTGADLRNRIVLAWFNQNNVNDPEQSAQVTDEMAYLLAGRGARSLFLSTLGQYIMSYADGRIKVVNHENQMNKVSGSLQYKHLLHLQKALARNHFDTRAELCLDAPATPALLHPGMTEAQVAATYGIVPFSYFFDYSTVPWLPENLTFQGYRSAAGVPVGGSADDYWIRSVVDGATSVGTLYVNQGGSWATYSLTSNTQTHMVPELGNLKLSARLKAALEQRNW